MMKIIFLINSLKNSGGMERVLTNKVNYFSKIYNYDISVITTDQLGFAPFYFLEKNIKCLDLKINYSQDFEKSFYKRIVPFILKQKKHKKLLEKKIFEIQPDFVVSLGCEDTYFLPLIKGNFFKIREFHFGKNFRKQYVKSFKKNFLYKIKAYIDTLREERLIKKYDKIVLLTYEDLKNWKNKEKIEVIYNSISNIPERFSDCKNYKIISVGRLDGQKGYDRLVEVWRLVKEKSISDKWILEIYGDGIDKNNILRKIKKYKLEKSFILKGVTKDIESKYLESSFYVMASRYEGFGMVLIEALASGLPLISFDCLSGPRDIIINGENGYLIKDGNLEDMAEKIVELMSNEEKRIEFGKNARKNIEKYKDYKIMNKWKLLFENLKKEKNNV